MWVVILVVLPLYFSTVLLRVHQQGIGQITYREEERGRNTGEIYFAVTNVLEKFESLLRIESLFFRGSLVIELVQCRMSILKIYCRVTIL